MNLVVKKGKSAELKKVLQASQQQLEGQVSLIICKSQNAFLNIYKKFPNFPCEETFWHFHPGWPEHPPGHDQQVGRWGEGVEGGTASKVSHDDHNHMMMTMVANVIWTWSTCDMDMWHATWTWSTSWLGRWGGWRWSSFKGVTSWWQWLLMCDNGWQRIIMIDNRL